MKELQYDNIITELKTFFPEFISDKNWRNVADDDPGIYLTMLISYVGERWENLSIQECLARFMDTMAKSQDIALKITFSNFVLDFYLHFEEHKIDFQSFMTNMLVPETRNFIQDCADYWYMENKAIKK